MSSSAALYALKPIYVGLAAPKPYMDMSDDVSRLNSVGSKILDLQSSSPRRDIRAFNRLTKRVNLAVSRFGYIIFHLSSVLSRGSLHPMNRG